MSTTLSEADFDVIDGTEYLDAPVTKEFIAADIGTQRTFAFLHNGGIVNPEVYDIEKIIVNSTILGNPFAGVSYVPGEAITTPVVTVDLHDSELFHRTGANAVLPGRLFPPKDIS